jgi:alkylation response protein AidB-like acyl-CoA dehydrogenase
MLRPDRSFAAVLDAVRERAPRIAARAPEIEAARRLPLDLVDDLIDAGCFRVLLPTSHGGLGGDLPSALEVLEELARADASTAWTVMIGAGGFCDLTSLPRATFDEIFDGGRVITAGVFNPTGTATRAGGGYRVRGRWSFASGCQHATVLYANCMADGEGEPPMRIVVLTPDQVEIEDTWHVSGLCGTGSHHFRVDDVVVPAERTVDALAEEACIDAPIAHVSPPSLYAIGIATVAIGAARGALEDVLALAGGKVPLLAGAPLAANPLFQHQLADADTALRAARALLREVATEAWRTAVDGGEPTLDQRARCRAAGAWATTCAAEVVDVAYGAGGGSALYLDSPLQRRLRDVHAITQHFLVKPDTLTLAGAVVAGEPLDVPMF